MPGRRMRAVSAVGLGALTVAATFAIWTRKCRVEDLSGDDALLERSSFAKFNPTPVPSSEMRDVCTRRLSLEEVRQDLLEDTRKGGSALIEGFAQGIWGGSGE